MQRRSLFICLSYKAYLCRRFIKHQASACASQFRKAKPHSSVACSRIGAIPRNISCAFLRPSRIASEKTAHNKTAARPFGCTAAVQSYVMPDLRRTKTPVAHSVPPIIPRAIPVPPAAYAVQSHTAVPLPPPGALRALRSQQPVAHGSFR